MKKNNTKNVECAGGIIINEFKEVAIVNQNYDSWSLPKGHIDIGEDPLTAAKREIYEETGISELMLIKEIGSYNRYKIGLNGKDDFSELKTIYIYIFKTKKIALQPLDPNNPFAKWVPCLEVPKYLTHKEDIKFFTNSLNLWFK